MTVYNNRDIFFSSKEYRSNYNSLLNSFLSKHEDFDEMNFIEYELDLYDLCVENTTLTPYTFEGLHKYAVNFGNCRFIISSLYDNLVTFKEENDGWDLELALKYQVTFKKIIEFLKERKDLISGIKTKKYNNVLSTSKTPEVRKLLTKILHDDITIFNVINYINDNTNNETYDFFIKEFNSCCEYIFYDFMFNVNDADIKTALEINENNLEYVYVYEDELVRIKHFVKEINNIKTVWNVSGLKSEQAENTIELVYLNNMMIDYYDGFFANEIEGFENIINLKNIWYHLNNKERKSSQIKKEQAQTNITKTSKLADKWHALLYLIEVEVYKKEIPTNHEGAFIKSKIEEIGKQRCKNSGQGFYRQVRDLKGNIKSNINVKQLFNDNWKDVIIDLSKNDENIIKYLENFYK